MKAAEIFVEYKDHLGTDLTVVNAACTPFGKRVALYSAKQDLPIGTKLYAAPSPCPQRSQ